MSSIHMVLACLNVDTLKTLSTNKIFVFWLGTITVKLYVAFHYEIDLIELKQKIIKKKGKSQKIDFDGNHWCKNN